MGIRIVVIGGGAAGFFSAINIAEKCPNVEVVILEKTTKTLSKVKVSGGGRCNVTHACFVPKELSAFYPRGEKELLGPFHTFMTGDTIAWFSDRGVELKMEDDGRMFPVSDSSQTIIDCFQNEINKHKVKVQLSTEVKSIVEGKDGFQIQTNKESIIADTVVLAVGGNSKVKHYEWIESLGHTISQPIPSLFTFNLKKHASNELMGLAMNASVRIVGTKFEEYGPVLFTHWGMSGPGILKLSAKAAKYLFERSYQFDYEVEWISNAKDLVDGLRKTNSKMQLSNTKIEGFPSRFWIYLLQKGNMDSKKRWADLNKKELEKLVQLLSKDDYFANGKTTFKEEFVTAGGINLKEVNMKTMESKIIPKLYFSGEVLNIDGYTGGFNFQAAWTGGFIVADGISKQLAI
ncbi:MAG: putative Rossmann fold flavoprotein [Vicingaceae bacterium]|jgi:predicted Rossmann fold flavoprotein